MQVRNSKGQFTSKLMKAPQVQLMKERVLLDQLTKHIDRMIEEKLTKDFRQYWLSFIKDLAYSYELNEKLEWD